MLRNYFLPISYTFAFGIIIASLFVTILYGHSFGYVKSILWLSAFIFSVGSSMFVIEPIQLFVKSIIVAIFFTKSDNTAAANEQIPTNYSHQSSDKYFAYKNLINAYRNTNFTITYENLTTHLTKEELREKERLIIKYRDLFRDLLLVSMYLMILLMIVLGSKDPFAYYSTKTIKDHFVYGKFLATNSSWNIRDDVSNENDFLNYIKESLLPTVHYSSGFQNEAAAKNPENSNAWLPGKNVKILGVARLRQHRIIERRCGVEEEQQPHLFSPDSCFPEFSNAAIDTNSYGPQWRQLRRRQQIDYNSKFNLMLKPWQYQTAWQTKALSVFGKDFLYNGGGYILKLGRTLNNSMHIIQFAEQNKWLDRRTRVVFIEMSMYSVNTNLFNIVTIAAERTVYGNYVMSANVKSVKLLIVLADLPGVTLSVFAMYIFSTIIYVCRVSVALWKHKIKLFFGNTWNCIDFFIVLLSVGLVVLFFERNAYVSRLLNELEQANNNEFVSFIYAAQFEQITTWWSGILIALATVRIWKILNFIVIFRIISKTLQLAASTLVWTTVLLVLIVGMFSLCVHNFNGTHTHVFATLPKTIVSLSIMSLGFGSDDDGFNSGALMFGGQFFGRVLYFLLMISINIFMLNLFITVLCINFAVIQNEEARAAGQSKYTMSFYQFIKIEFTHWWINVSGSFRKKNTQPQQIPKIGGNIYDHSRIEIERMQAKFAIIEAQLEYIEEHTISNL